MQIIDKRAPQQFFIAFISVNNYESIKPVLIDFKNKIRNSGEITVLDFTENDYNYFYNAFMERAGNLKKGRG
jgi:hypothetical protein